MTETNFWIVSILCYGVALHSLYIFITHVRLAEKMKGVVFLAIYLMIGMLLPTMVSGYEKNAYKYEITDTSGKHFYTNEYEIKDETSVSFANTDGKTIKFIFNDIKKGSYIYYVRNIRHK